MPFGRVAFWRDVERPVPLYICPLMNCPTRSELLAAMAPIAAAIVLGLGLPATGAAQGKPCRTPCLATSVPEAVVPESAAAKPQAAEKATVPARPPPAKPRVQAAPPARVAQREDEGPAAPPRRPAPSPRCSEINMRAAVGEPLTDQDMTYLRSQC